MPAARVEVSEVAAWNEVINLVAPKGEASLGFNAARTIWAHPGD